MTPDEANCAEARITSQNFLEQRLANAHERQRRFQECQTVPGNWQRSLHRVLVVATSSQDSSCITCLTAETCQTVLCSHSVTWIVLVLGIEISRALHAIVMASVLIMLQNKIQACKLYTATGLTHTCCQGYQKFRSLTSYEASSANKKLKWSDIGSAPVMHDFIKHAHAKSLSGIAAPAQEPAAAAAGHVCSEEHCMHIHLNLVIGWQD